MTTAALAIRDDVADLVVQRTDSWMAVVEEVGLLASRIAGTEFVPAALRGKPAAVAAAILFGREVGMPPMTALQSVYVVNGKVALSAEAMRGLILAAGHRIVFRESTSARCVAAGQRAGDDEWSTVEWTVDNARQAGLLGNPTWAKYPRPMLKARATAELARDLFADVIAGFVAVEEIETAGVAVASDTTTATPARRRVRRRDAAPEAPSPQVSEDAAPPPGQAIGPVADTTLPLPGEPGYADVVPSGHQAVPAEPLPQTDGEPEQDSPGRRDTSEWDIHAAQRTKVLALFHDLGITDRAVRLRVTSLVVGHDVESTNDLTRGQASLLIDTLVLWTNTKGMREAFTAVMQEPDPMASMDDVMARIAAARKSSSQDHLASPDDDHQEP